MGGAGALRLQFLGAAGFVTGSRTLLEYGGFRLYVDCGLYQGPAYVEERNFLPLETNPETIDAILLTHAHIDHSGLIPRLYKEGFRGTIFCTKPTAALLGVILPDAGHIQEEDFYRRSKKELKKLGLTEPLFTREDGNRATALVKSVPYNRTFRVGPFSASFTWAGHILGAAHLRLAVKDLSIAFSGDIGPESAFFHKPLKKMKPAEYIVTESTYGNRVREEEDYEKKFIDAVRYVLARRGMLVIPAFAVGRAQTALFVLHTLIKKKKIPELPIALDSPMAVKATEIYRKFRNELSSEVVRSGFFQFLRSRHVKFIQSAEESKALADSPGPGIIVSASGMCNGGRVLHHLERRLGDQRNAILFTGYAGVGTLAHEILKGTNRVTIFGMDTPVRAMVSQVQAFSAHADQRGLLSWMRQFKKEEVRRIFINHGEDEAREGLANELRFMQAPVELPRYESTYYLPVHALR